MVFSSIVVSAYSDNEKVAEQGIESQTSRYGLEL